MDPKSSLAQTLRSDLIQFPKKALAVDKTWKQLLKFYPKVQFKKITSQQQWDDFYSIIPEKVRKQFIEKPIDDPLLWLYGPISQEPPIQKLLSQIVPASIKEEPKQKEKGGEDAFFRRHETKSPDSLQGETRKVNEAELATPPSTPIPAPQVAIPVQSPITIITQTRAPVGKVLRDLQEKESAPQGIITPAQANAATYSGKIITSNPMPAPLSPIITNSNSAAPSGPILASSRSTMPMSQPPKPISKNFFRDVDLANTDGDEVIDVNPPEIAQQASQRNKSTLGAQSLNSSSEYSPPMTTSEPNPESEDQDTGNNSGNQPRSASRPRSRGRVPSRGMLPRIPGGLGSGAKVARLVAFIGPWGWAAIGIAIFILIVVLIIMKPASPSDGVYPAPTVELTTGDTTVENPEEKVQGLATSSAINKSVLGLVDNLKDLLDDTADRIREFAEKYQKSLVTYTITGNYSGPAYEVKIVYPIPEKARFISASGVFTEQKGTDKTTGLPKTTSVTWLFSQNNGSSPSAITTNAVATEISYARYTQPPYSLPQPQGVSDVTYNQTTIDALNRLGGAIAQNSSYLKSKFSSQFVDPFLSVIWVGAIEGIGDQPYFWNCRDVSRDINSGCAGGYYSGGWQVGYGIQVAQVGGHLAADFDSIYGSGKSSDPNEVKRVGQAVISGSGGKIRNPAIFPSDTIPSLVSKANSGNQAAQQAIAILLMDQKLGATAIALEVAADISAGNNWAQTMRGWGSYYGNNMQNFSNRAKAIADKYSGVGGENGGGSSGTIFGSKSFTVTLLPIVKDDVLQSGSAVITVDEVPGTNIDSPTSSESGTMTETISGGHVPPSTNTCNIYSLSSNPAGKNYGDPTCNYDKNKLFDLLKKLDPANANLWFNKIIPCESAYNPNEFYRTGAAGDTPDPYGAWGLYQMGRGADGPFINLTRGSTNNPTRPEDRGDVNWELQTSNAVNFNKKYLIPNGLALGAYWQCAR